VRLPEVINRTGMSRTVIYRARSAGTFPAPVKLSARCVGWRESDVDVWIAARPSAVVGVEKREAA
jgi:prophage regulatory protein